MNSLRIEGQKIVAVELCQQLGWEVPDWVVIPGGNLGNASALGRGFELLLAARADLRAARASRGAGRRRPIRSTGPSSAASHRSRAGEGGAHAGLRDPDRRPGVAPPRGARAQAPSTAWWSRPPSPSWPTPPPARTGRAPSPARTPAWRWRRWRSWRRAGTIARGSRVAVISTAHGLKFADFKVGYHRGTLPEVQSRAPNPPLEVPAAVAERAGRAGRPPAALVDCAPRERAPGRAPARAGSPSGPDRHPRASIAHLARGTVSTVFSLMIYGLAALFQWEQAKHV